MRAIVEGHSLILTEHTVRRYIERVRCITDPSHREYQFYERELARLLTDFASLSPDPPQWSLDVPIEEKALPHEHAFFAIISDDMAFPIVLRKSGYIVLTTLTRGGLTHTHREKRSAKKRHKREAAKTRRQFESWRGEAKPRWN